jgi:hypothetical protein
LKLPTITDPFPLHVVVTAMPVKSIDEFAT